jgi:hypothetical protein
MIAGLGGVESSEYRQFCSLACQAFNALRKSAGLVLNLLHLMSDAGIEDLSNDPTGAKKCGNVSASNKLPGHPFELAVLFHLVEQPCHRT